MKPQYAKPQPGEPKPGASLGKPVQAQVIIRENDGAVEKELDQLRRQLHELREQMEAMRKK